MTDLAGHVTDYLTLRRALGFKLKREGEVLPQFVAYLDAASAKTITVELAVAWAELPEGVLPISWAHRLGAVRGFAKYLHTIDQYAEVPPRDVFGARQQRHVPYLYSESDIHGLLNAARHLQPRLRAVTHEALFGLLAVSGMRVGEAIGLERSDIDLTEALITIREAKFGRSRLVPLHPTATAALRSYAICRDRLCPKPRSRAFFISSVGTRLGLDSVDSTFRRLATATGLRSETVWPRLHDLRHTFAVRTLIDWERSGIDVGTRMALLSTYLGHVNPASTYWYLSAAPELMELAAARLDGQYGSQR